MIIKASKLKPLTCIDLFAGCGGLSLGLEQAGFKPLLVSELNASAIETYLANRKGQDIAEFRDIYQLTDGKLRGLRQKWKEAGHAEVDLVAGGPPCQGYSGIGHRRSYKVDKEEVPSNHLYKEMIRVIRAVQPKMFLFENVRGILSGRWTPEGEKGEIWNDVLGSFRELSRYDIRWKLVHAKDYGVPQNRPRVLMVGIRRDLGWAPPAMGDAVADGLLPRPRKDYPNPIDVFGDLLDADFLQKQSTDRYPDRVRSDFQESMRTGPDGRVAKKGDPLTEHEYSNHSPRIRQKFKHMLANDGEIPPEMKTKKFAQRVIPRAWGPGGPNITATSLADDYVHFEQPRSLTVREWARLQTFPDWYQFCGPRTTGGLRRAGMPTEGIWDREVPKYTQIGNAVPVKLAQVVGAHFSQILRS